MEKLNMHTPDITEDNIGCIGRLFPNCLTNMTLRPWTREG